MSEKVSIASTQIKHKGIFDMGELYKVMKSWLDEKGYGDEEKSFREELYVERIKGASKQIEIRWKAEKAQGEYFSHIIKVTFLIAGLTEVEIEQDGIKLGTNKADVTIKISSDMVKDRKNKWKIDFFRKIYEDLIIDKRIEEYWDGFYGKTYGFIDEIKGYLQLRT